MGEQLHVTAGDLLQGNSKGVVTTLGREGTYLIVGFKTPDTATIIDISSPTPYFGNTAFQPSEVPVEQLTTDHFSALPDDPDLEARTTKLVKDKMGQRTEPLPYDYVKDELPGMSAYLSKDQAA